MSDTFLSSLLVTGLVPGTQYTLVVSGVRDTSAASNLADQSALFSLAFWQNQDVGAVAAVGSLTIGTSHLSVAGSGADIYGNADEFHFVYQPLHGDGEIVARVTSLVKQNPYSKAGVMIRETLDAGSKHALVAVTPDHGVEFNSRDATAGPTNNPRLDGPAAPYWVRMVRAGDTLSASASPDGVVWTSVSSRQIAMAADVLIGLAVTSHNDGQISTAEFESVAVTRVRPVDGWLSGHGLSQADLLRDPDGDGLSVGVEYALGLHPFDTDHGSMPVASESAGILSLSYTRPQPVPPDVSYRCEVSLDMAIWVGGDDVTWPEELTDNLDGTETVTVRSRLPAGEPRQFMRLAIVVD